MVFQKRISYCFDKEKIHLDIAFNTNTNLLKNSIKRAFSVYLNIRLYKYNYAERIGVYLLTFYIIHLENSPQLIDKKFEMIILVHRLQFMHYRSKR